MSREKCGCDGGDGEFCPDCCPGLGTWEGVGRRLLPNVRIVLDEMRLSVENCCGQDKKKKKCERCKELMLYVGYLEGE